MAARKPNILFLMTDQMQGRVLAPDHPCQTPNFDRLAERGVRISRAYTPNAVCSPARASLMTGLLPHSHGVLTVTHCVHDDQAVLRTDKPHWAQRLADAGYRTGYFGKWHVERSNDLTQFGWQVNGESSGGLHSKHAAKVRGAEPAQPTYSLSKSISGPQGYPDALLYGVHDTPPEKRGMGITSSLAAEFLDDAMGKTEPWCCFASVLEPHDPFVTSREAFERYSVDDIPVPRNWNDDLTDRPGLYWKAARVFAGLTEKQKKEAAACYYASITEIDEQFGRLIDQVERAGQLDDTVVVLTTDHGEFLGAHGLYQKNVGAFEEAYNIPLVMSGPGIATGAVSDARVGLHDLCPTLLELAGLDTIGEPESRSFAPVLRDPDGESKNYRTGYAEYYGTRYWFTQRVIWDGRWKLVWNGFDFDELYNLDDDPHELRNLAGNPACQERLRKLMAQAWRIIRETDDHPLGGSKYATLRLAPFGPGVVDD
ncbi:MAG: sulfatase-like hydrolase/transferase [Armatimonadota bacterium]